MYSSMIEFRAEVNNSINSLREDLNVLHDSVSNLSMCLQEHKKQTETELADLRVCCNSTDSKLDSLTHKLEKVQEHVDQLAVHTCGGTGGWRRVVHLDMTNLNTTCPSGWNMTKYSKRTCGRATDGTNTCDSATYPVRGGEYRRICGKIRAYQHASPDGFRRIPSTLDSIIDNAYIDGVSVTHGTPRNHIWAFVAGISEGNPTWSHACPCDASIEISVPSFVGEDYFCESAVNRPWVGGSTDYTFHPNDTLWDREDCLPSSTCCSRRNPPYFVKQLPNSTTDDIEARICLDEVMANENIAVELVELYVQWW